MRPTAVLSGACDLLEANKATKWLEQELIRLQSAPLPACPSTLPLTRTEDGVIESEKAKALCIIYVQIIHESKIRDRRGPWDGSQHAARIDAIEDRLGVLIGQSLNAEKQAIVLERQEQKDIALYARLYAGWKLTLEEIAIHPNGQLPEDTIPLPCELF